MISIAPKELSTDEQAALQANLAQLTAKQQRAMMRSNFYNGKERLHYLGFSIPPQMSDMEAALGWPAKTCDVLSSRVRFGGFVLPGKLETEPELDEIWSLNQMAVRWPQIQTSTFMHGAAFVAVTPGDTSNGEPEVLISAMPATEATGIWDVRRQALTSALWVPQQDAMYPTSFVLFLPHQTIQATRARSGDWQVDRIDNPLPRVPVTMTNYRPQLDRPYGMSRITRPVMYLTQMAVRTLLRTEVSAEFYSSPQRWAMGADEDAFVDEAGNRVSPWETILGKVWMIPRPAGDDGTEGDLPAVGQFPQASMQPHVDQSRWIASAFSGETSLPVSTLGVIHDNPASAEAIDAAWADMVGVAELCQPELGVRAAEIGQNILMLANGDTELPRSLIRLGAKWLDASTPTRQAQTQATIMEIQAGVLLPHSRVAMERLGYTETDIQRVIAEHKKDREDREARPDPPPPPAQPVAEEPEVPVEAPVPA